MNARVPTIRRTIAVLMALPLASTIGGCATQDYRPQPLEPARVAQELGDRRDDDAGLRDFMERHGYKAEQWPLPQWDLEALTLMAVYFHPDMEVARANLELQRAGKITAGERPNPRGGPLIEHHSAASNGTVDTPWSIGLGLYIPIELGGKRDARLARAEQLGEEARLAVAEAAWRVRSRLRQRFVESFAATAASDFNKREFDLRQQEFAMLERRQKAGEAGPSEVSLSHLHLQESRLALDSGYGNIRSTRAALAAALGLPFEKTEDLRLAFDKLAAGATQALPADAMQQAALQNRLDLREAQARYGAAEATLREEIARQYPDLDLSPGFLWDKGDWIKSLGAMVLLPILNNNEGPIAEAEAKRRLEAARFKSLEADVFAELATARVRFETALTTWKTATSLVEAQSKRLDEVKKLIAYGESDRLTLVESEIELLAAQRAELQAKVIV